MSVTVTSTCGSTTASVEYYTKADKRLAKIRERWLAEKATDDQVIQAVSKITGMSRIDADWKIANEGKECPKNKDAARFGLDNFEEWVAKQPEEHKRLYGSYRVIAAVLLDRTEAV